MAILSDEFYYQPLRIDTINTRVYADLLAKEGDANGRGLLVTLTENGLMKDTTGIALNLKWEHTSVGNQGLDNFEAVDLSKGLYKITYPTEMLNRGKVRAFIQIIDSGKLAGIRNIEITVDRGVGDDTAIESSNEFRALASALIEVQSWNTRIDAVEADFIQRANNMEATYPQELLSVKQQLAEKANIADLPSSAYTFKGSTTFAALPTTGNTLGDVRWATDTALNYAWTGAAWTPIGNGAFADGSVVTSKLADKAVTIDKTGFAQRTNLFNYLTFTLGKKINTNVGVNNIFTDYATIAWALVSPVYNVVAGETYTVKILGEASPDINKVVFADLTGKVCATLSFAAYATTLTFTVPENAIHMRINAVKSGTTYEQFMLVRGSVMPSTFVPHAKYTAPDLTIADEQVPSVPKLKTDVTTLKSDVLALKTVASNQWTGKKAVAYGCSVTEMLASNGDSWEVKVKAVLGFDKFYNRGKGGSTMSNIDTTGSMYIYVDDSQWDETATSVNASAEEFDGGVTVKWLNPWYVNPERILTIPTDADLILIDASTNDFYRRTPLGTLPFKSPWEVSQTGAIVYDKGTMTGAIGSLVTQLQARCPNAKIVFWGMPYNDGITATSGDLFFEYYAKIQDTVRKMGCEFIDVESKMQVNINNLTATFTDGVHPATTARGLNLLANAMVAGLKDIHPLPAL